MITKQDSSVLKGVSIIFVVCAHVFGGQVGWLPAKLTTLLGTGGVFVFLLLSGYGLFISTKSISHSFISFWNKRLAKVWIPYCIITIAYWVFLRIMRKTISVELLISNLFCVDYHRIVDGTMWYLSYLFLWYCAFSVVFLFDIHDLVKILVLFALGYLFLIYNWDFKDCSWQFSVNAFAFPIGVLIGWLSQFTGKAKMPEYVFVTLGVLALGLLIPFYLKNSVQSIWYNLRHFLFFIILFVTCHYLSKIQVIYKSLDMVGKCSYDIYLVEAKLIAFIQLVFGAFVRPSQPLLYLMVYMVLLLSVCVVIRRSRSILNKYTQRYIPN